jgi:uncharacterized membrane protein YqaE (UPF0057 family)
VAPIGGGRSQRGIDDWMQTGYDLQEAGQREQACRIWMRCWTAIEEHSVAVSNRRFNHPDCGIDDDHQSAPRKALSMNKLLLVIIAILLPPLAVGLKAGIGFHLFLNIILTLLVYLPGLLHALWVVLKD